MAREFPRQIAEMRSQTLEHNMSKNVATTSPAKSGEVLAPEKGVQDASTQAVSTIKENLPANAALMDALGAMPTGLENVTSRDLIIPRLVILQALSPQLNERKPEYIKDARVGMFCDTALGDVFQDQILLLPCYFAVVYLEWAPRASGKGLVANHGTDANCLNNTTRDADGKNVTKDGNYIAETATYFCLNLTAGGRRCFVPLTSTQLKASRKWMTLITNQRLTRLDGTEFTPPIFFRSWKAILTHETNAKGDWFGWKFEPGENVFEIDPSGALLKEAKDFYEQARSGLVSGDLTNFDDAETMGGDHVDNDARAM